MSDRPPVGDTTGTDERTAMPTDPDRERGLYGKYRVEKVNGKPVGECFVLEEHDPLAIVALRAYADACADGYRSLATDLALMADRWHDNHIARDV